MLSQRIPEFQNFNVFILICMVCLEDEVTKEKEQHIHVQGFTEKYLTS
jgi:hypothetical protein